MRLALITPSKVFVYEGREQIAQLLVQSQPTAEQIETVRVADYSVAVGDDA